MASATATAQPTQITPLEQPAALAPSDTANEQGDIVVTANKREERLRDVAMGISAISGDDLLKRQLRSFADYVPLIPGLSIQSTSPTVNRLTIRGLNAGGAGASVGIYVDDSPMGSSNGLAGGAVYTTNSDTWDLQRVEVLRGPQGTLYGANTEGGLIKFVSNAPDPTALSGMMQVGAVAFDGGNAKGSVKGVINVPLVSAKAALRVSGFYEGLPGYINDPQLGLKDANEGHRLGIRGSLLVLPTDNLRLRVTAFYQDTKVGAAPFIDVVGNATSYAAPPANQFDPSGPDLTQNRFLREPYQSDVINVSGSIEWTTPFATITSISTYAKSNFNVSVAGRPPCR